MIIDPVLAIVTLLAVAVASCAAGWLARETRRHRLSDMDRDALLKLAERRRAGRLT
jgi:hypothetical protein